MPKSGSDSGSILRIGGWKIRIRVDSSEWVFVSPTHYKIGICSDTTNVCVAMEPDLLKSSLFHADQRLCSAEILPPSQVCRSRSSLLLDFFIVICFVGSKFLLQWSPGAGKNRSRRPQFP